MQYHLVRLNWESPGKKQVYQFRFYRTDTKRTYVCMNDIKKCTNSHQSIEDFLGVFINKAETYVELINGVEKTLHFLKTTNAIQFLKERKKVGESGVRQVAIIDWLNKEAPREVKAKTEDSITDAWKAITRDDAETDYHSTETVLEGMETLLNELEEIRNGLPKWIREIAENAGSEVNRAATETPKKETSETIRIGSEEKALVDNLSKKHRVPKSRIINAALKIAFKELETQMEIYDALFRESDN